MYMYEALHQFIYANGSYLLMGLCAVAIIYANAAIAPSVATASDKKPIHKRVPPEEMARLERNSSRTALYINDSAYLIYASSVRDNWEVENIETGRQMKGNRVPKSIKEAWRRNNLLRKRTGSATYDS